MSAILPPTVPPLGTTNDEGVAALVGLHIPDHAWLTAFYQLYETCVGLTISHIPHL